MPNALRPTRRGVIAGTAALLVLRPARAAEPLVLRAAGAELPLADAVLATPAFDGLSAGPLLEMERGQPFAIRVENTLDFAFRFRAQGLRGTPVQGGDTPIAPGETRELVITAPDAGTFVYCAAAEDANAARTVLLSGPLIVNGEAPRIADQEALVAVNTILLPETDPAKPPRRIVTVNGAADLKLPARPAEKLRLRLVNLAQDGIAGLKLPKGAQIVAIDSQPCPPFPPFGDIVILPPLGRADVVLDVPRDTAAPLAITDAFDSTLVLVTVTAEGDPMPDRFLAKQLPANPLLPTKIPFGSAARATWNPGEVSEPVRVEAGGSVVITFENGDIPHALLLGGLTARLLDRLDDGWKPWWQDTFYAHPGETTRFAFAAPGPGRYPVDMVALEGEPKRKRAWVEVQPSS